MRTLFAVLGLSFVACSGHPPDADPCAGRGAGDLVITELLADPSGTDTGHEWFEIFNTVGTDVELSGFTVYSGAKSHLVRAGTAAARGYFVFGDVRSGALPPYVGYSYGADLGELAQTTGRLGIRCRDNVIDEVAYSVAAKPGHARQLDGRLVPDATLSGDETNWCDASSSYDGMNFGTPGAANDPCVAVVTTGGCIDDGGTRELVVPGPGALEISEVMANPRAVSDAVGEWVEVHAKAACDLNGVTLTSGTSSAVLKGSDCLHLAAGDWAVLAKTADAGVNGGLPNVRATFAINLLNAAGTIALSVDDAGIASAQLPAALDGVSWQLDVDAGVFCAASQAFGGGDYGTPGAPNSPCATMKMPTGDTCVDAVSGQLRAVRHPAFGDITLSEWMPDPKQVPDVAGEWIEAHAFRSFDLNGLVVGNGTASSVLADAGCLGVEAGELLLFARSSDPATNGGLPRVRGLFTFDLVNSGGSVSLGLADGTVLDSVTYPAATRGASFFIDGSRCDPLQYSVPPEICVTPVGVTYGESSDGGSGDRGTPGAPNGACP